MTQAWAKLARLTATASGCTRNITTPAATNGTTWAIVIAVHSMPVRSMRRASTRGRQWTAASSGSGSAATALRLPAGDRQPHDHQVGVDRQLAHLLGLALASRDHPEVAAVELLAERPHRRLDRLRVVGRPFRQRRVAGLVHANQTGHRTFLRGLLGRSSHGKPAGQAARPVGARQCFRRAGALIVIVKALRTGAEWGRVIVAAITRVNR